MYLFAFVFSTSHDTNDSDNILWSFLYLMTTMISGVGALIRPLQTSRMRIPAM